MEAIKAIPTWRRIIPNGAIFFNKDLITEEIYLRFNLYAVFIIDKSKIINGMPGFF